MRVCGGVKIRMIAYRADGSVCRVACFGTMRLLESFYRMFLALLD